MSHAAARGSDAPLPFCAILLGGPGAGRRTRSAAGVPALDGGGAGRDAAAWELPRPGFRGDPAASLTIFPLPTSRAIVDKTYTAAIFRSDEITPVKTLDRAASPELSNGPTLAFKDVAMQLLGNLFE